MDVGLINDRIENHTKTLMALRQRLVELDNNRNGVIEQIAAYSGALSELEYWKTQFDVKSGLSKKDNNCNEGQQ